MNFRFQDFPVLLHPQSCHLGDKMFPILIQYQSWKRVCFRPNQSSGRLFLSPRYRLRERLPYPGKIEVADIPTKSPPGNPGTLAVKTSSQKFSGRSPGYHRLAISLLTRPLDDVAGKDPGMPLGCGRPAFRPKPDRPEALFRQRRRSAGLGRPISGYSYTSPR